MEYVAAIAAIVGLVNGLRLIGDKNYIGFAYFAAALVAGSLFGYLNWVGLPGVEAGFIAGLASSGFYRGAQII